MKRRKSPTGKKKSALTHHCWEFFHCDPLVQKNCLMSEIGSTPCWLVDVACCRMPADTPHPISLKKVICKTCAFYIYVNKTSH